MPLPSFTLTGNLNNVLGDVAGGELVAQGLSGTIKLTPNVPGGFVEWAGDLYRISPVTGRITGTAITRNGLPMQLLANDPGLNVTGLQWHAEITTRPDPGTDFVNTLTFTFDAPADNTTVDLADVVPVPGTTVTGITKGDSVDDVVLTDGALQFYIHGDPVGDPLPLPSGGTVAWGGITGKPAVIAAGADAAAARAVIDAATTGSVTAALSRANHTGTQLAATISDFGEAVQDTVGAAIVAGTNITATYNDAAGTVTIASTAASGGISLTDDGTGLFVVGSGGNATLTDDGTGLFLIG